MSKKIYKKVSATQVKLADKAPGFELEGKFVGINQSQFVDKEGEEKVLHTMILEREDGERLKFLADAGLRTAIQDAMIQPGDHFKAVKCDKIDIGRGRTLNQWDIFQFSE